MERAKIIKSGWCTQELACIKMATKYQWGVSGFRAASQVSLINISSGCLFDEKIGD